MAMAVASLAVAPAREAFNAVLSVPEDGSHELAPHATATSLFETSSADMRGYERYRVSTAHGHLWVWIKKNSCTFDAAPSNRGLFFDKNGCLCLASRVPFRGALVVYCEVKVAMEKGGEGRSYRLDDAVRRGVRTVIITPDVLEERGTPDHKGCMFRHIYEAPRSAMFEPISNLSLEELMHRIVDLFGHIRKQFEENPDVIQARIADPNINIAVAAILATRKGEIVLWVSYNKPELIPSSHHLLGLCYLSPQQTLDQMTSFARFNSLELETERTAKQVIKTWTADELRFQITYEPNAVAKKHSCRLLQATINGQNAVVIKEREVSHFLSTITAMDRNIAGLVESYLYSLPPFDLGDKTFHDDGIPAYENPFDHLPIEQ